LEAEGATGNTHGIDDSVKVLQALLLENPRVHVILEVSVVDLLTLYV
jgi:hypothetical protein